MFDHARPVARTRLLLSLLVALALILTGCGSSDTTTTSGQPALSGDGVVDADAEGDTPDVSDDEVPGETTDETTGQTDSGDADNDDTRSQVDSVNGEATGADTIGALLFASVDEPMSSRFEGRIEMTGEPGSEMPGTVSLTFSGAQDPANRASELTMDFSGLVDALAQAEGGEAAEMAMFAGMLTDPIRVIAIGDTSYVQWSLLTMFTGGDGDMWLETTDDEVDDLTSGFGMQTFGSIEEVLAPLRDANATIVTLGTETVRGMDTTHFAADIQFQAWYDGLSAEERAAFDAEYDDFALGETEIVVPIELWITDDGRVAKMFYDISDPALLADSEGLTSATMTIEVYDYGADVAITPPPADKIISEDEIDMGFGA